MRDTATPWGRSASSMATRLGWSRPDPAPGVSSAAQPFFDRRWGEVTVASVAAEENALGLGQVVDARPGAVAVAPVVGMRGADEGAEAAHHLAPGRLGAGPESQD